MRLLSLHRSFVDVKFFWGSFAKPYIAANGVWVQKLRSVSSTDGMHNEGEKVSKKEIKKTALCVTRDIKRKSKVKINK
eukprot:gene9540-6697_t